MFHKILVALDRSIASQQVLETAIALAKAMQGQLMLINVISPLESNYPSPLFAVEGSYPMFRSGDIETHVQQLRTLESVSLEFLKDKTAIATAAGVATEFTQALGDPGPAICSLANTWNTNLILIGRRGYSGFSELFLGSISNYVMHHAPCSVLTVQGAIDLDEDKLAQGTIAATPTAVSAEMKA